MNRELVKTIVVSLGTASSGYVVSSALKNLTPTESKLQVVAKFVGVIVIGGMINKHTTKYLGETFDGIAEAIDELTPQND